MRSTLRSRFRAVRRKGISPGSPEAYFFALICAGVAAVVGITFSYFIDDITLSIAFYPAIFIAALIGGLQAAMTVVAIGMSMEWWADNQFFGDPKAALTPFFNRGLFLVAAAVVIWVAEELRRRNHHIRQPAEKSFSSDTNVVVHLLTQISYAARNQKGIRYRRLMWQWVAAQPYAAYIFALTCVAAHAR